MATDQTAQEPAVNTGEHKPEASATTAPVVDAAPAAEGATDQASPPAATAPAAPAAPAAEGATDQASPPAATAAADPAASAAKRLHRGLAATGSLMTLASSGTNGGARSKAYSSLNYGLAFDAMLWSEVFSQQAGFGFFASAQSLSFDASKDGRLAATKLTTYEYGLSLQLEPFAGLTVGPVVGSTTNPEVIAPAGTTLEIVAADAMLYGLAMSYSHSIGDGWQLGVGAQQLFTGATKAKGIDVEPGAGYRLSVAARYGFTPEAHLSLSYQLSEHRQDTAQSRLTRSEDLVAVGCGIVIGM